MKLLGIDFGEKKIGIAYSEGLLGTPLATILVKTRKQVFSELQITIERLGIEKIILGTPGGRLDKSIRSFGENLSLMTKLPVEYVDETLTSQEAIKKMIEGKTTKKKRREMEDEVAATIILNSYLEGQK